MTKAHLSSLSLVVLLPLASAAFVACGGETSSDTGQTGNQGGSSAVGGSQSAGSGTAGSGTAGSGTAGSGTAGSGTAGSGTAGKGTAGSGVAGSGSSGKAGSGTAGSSTTQCKSPGDCATTGLCTVCADGTTICEKADCVAGKCVSTLPSCPGSCAPVDAHGVGSCKKLIGFAWDGKQCQAVTGCSCEGTQCGEVTTEAACQAAHAGCSVATDPCAGLKCGDYCTTCDPNGPPCPPVVQYCDAKGQCTTGTPICATTCAPLDAQGVGLCDGFFGYAWNGKECNAITGCKCVGADCDKIIQSLEVCQATYAKCAAGDPCAGKACGDTCTTCAPGQPCPDVVETCDANGQCVVGNVACPGTSCTPQDATGEGMCFGFFGYAWTGKGCSAVTGCSCVGADCGATYASEDQCFSAHATCACQGLKCGETCPCLSSMCANTFYQCDTNGECQPGPQVCTFP